MCLYGLGAEQGEEELKFVQACAGTTAIARHQLHPGVDTVGSCSPALHVQPQICCIRLFAQVSKLQSSHARMHLLRKRHSPNTSLPLLLLTINALCLQLDDAAIARFISSCETITKYEAEAVALKLPSARIKVAQLRERCALQQKALEELEGMKAKSDKKLDTIENKWWVAGRA